MKFTSDKVNKIAALARLNLKSEEEKTYSKQISSVLDYMEVLNDADTDGVEETCQVTGLENVFREDVVESCGNDKRGELIDLFPEKEDGLLKVRDVFNGNNV